MSEFQDLKAGDEVVLLSGRFGDTRYSLEKIERVTKTLIIINGDRYRRADGRQTGESWHKNYLKMPTEEMLNKVKCYERLVVKRDIIKSFREFNFNKFSLEQLQQIQQFINGLETAVKDGE